MSIEHPNGITSDQIDAVLANVKQCWIKYPNLRLIQLIMSAAHKYTEFTNDTFYLEDSELIIALRNFANDI